MATRVYANRTTASRTSVRDSGIGLGSGYADAYAAGVGLISHTKHVPLTMQADLANTPSPATRRLPAARPGISSLAASTNG